MGRKIIQVVQEVWNRKDFPRFFFGHFSRCLGKDGFSGWKCGLATLNIRDTIGGYPAIRFLDGHHQRFFREFTPEKWGGKEDYVLSYWVRGTLVGENSLLNFGWVAPNNLDVQGKKWDPGISIKPNWEAPMDSKPWRSPGLNIPPPSQYWMPGGDFFFWGGLWSAVVMRHGNFHRKFGRDIHRSRGGMISSDMHQVKIRHNHSPASSKWPFDSPNRNHLSHPETLKKVTFSGSKRAVEWRT